MKNSIALIFLLSLIGISSAALPSGSVTTKVGDTVSVKYYYDNGHTITIVSK